MDNLYFRLNQTKQKKATAAKVKADHDKQWNYKAKDLNGLESFRSQQTQNKKDTQARVKADHDARWNYEAKGPSGLESFRFKQTSRDADWKKTGRDQVRRIRCCIQFKISEATNN